MNYLNEAVLKLIPVIDKEARAECEHFCAQRAYSVHRLSSRSEIVYAFEDNSGLVFVSGLIEPKLVYNLQMRFSYDPPNTAG